MTKEKLWAAIQHSLILHTGSAEADHILGAISELERLAAFDEREACSKLYAHSVTSLNSVLANRGDFPCAQIEMRTNMAVTEFNAIRAKGET